MAGSYSKVALSHICDPDKGRISVDQDPNHPKRIMVVDDHPILRFGIRQLVEAEPDLRICGEADSVNRALELANDLKPDVALVDLSLAESSGLSLIRELRELLPDLRVLVLSMHEETHFAERALRAGASAYILKSMPKNELLGVIRSVHAGKRHVPPEVAARLAEHLGDDDLTTRELDVLRLIRDGYRNKQIADALTIAETTVNFHIKNLVDKLGANDRTHAVTIAIRRGLLQI